MERPQIRVEDYDLGSSDAKDLREKHHADFVIVLRQHGEERHMDAACSVRMLPVAAHLLAEAAVQFAEQAADMALVAITNDLMQHLIDGTVKQDSPAPVGDIPSTKEQRMNDQDKTQNQGLQRQQQFDLEHIFQYHSPSPSQATKYEALRNEAKSLGKTILDLVPPGPDQSDALRKLRECIMTCNASIALNGRLYVDNTNAGQTTQKAAQEQGETVGSRR